MFEFPLLDEKARQELREMEAQRSIYRRKEALQVYYTLSCDFRGMHLASLRFSYSNPSA
jgi:hypothetical protein